MQVADFILSALCDQGVNHCFIGLGGLNDNFMPAMTGTKGLRTIVAAFEGSEHCPGNRDGGGHSRPGDHHCRRHDWLN